MAYQHLDDLRAIFNNRLAWSRLGLWLSGTLLHGLVDVYVGRGVWQTVAP